MIKLLDAVLNKPSFEKLATLASRSGRHITSLIALTSELAWVFLTLIDIALLRCDELFGVSSILITAKNRQRLLKQRKSVKNIRSNTDSAGFISFPRSVSLPKVT